MGSRREDWRKRLAECGARGVDLGLGVVRLDLEREVEACPRAASSAEQVVEHGDARRDVARPDTGLVPGASAGAAHSSAALDAAPRPRRRSSMRS